MFSMSLQVQNRVCQWNTTKLAHSFMFTSVFTRASKTTSKLQVGCSHHRLLIMSECEEEAERPLGEWRAWATVAIISLVACSMPFSMKTSRGNIFLGNAGAIWSFKKVSVWGWRGGSTVKSTGFSSRGSRFSSQHPQGSSELTGIAGDLTLTETYAQTNTNAYKTRINRSGDQAPFSDFHRYYMYVLYRHTCRQNTRTQKTNKNKRETDR